MDADAEAAKLKWFLGAAIVFIVSAFISHGELAYLVGGRDADARITRVREIEESTRRGLQTRKVIEYEFTDNQGHRRRGSDKVDVDWPVPEGSTIKVQYRSGEDGPSRLAGHTNLVGPIVFVAALIFLGVVGYRFWREVSEAVGGSKATSAYRCR
jgi:hypothetical protein